MLAFLNQVRKPTLDLPLEVRRKMWFKPFMQSYLVVFIGYLTMYLIRKNFNIAQNDMISTYGLSMTQLGMIGLGFSITYGVGKTLPSSGRGYHPKRRFRSALIYFYSRYKCQSCVGVN